MTTSSASYSSSNVEEFVPEINLVATIKLTPLDFVRFLGLEFTSSNNDLGSLVFTRLDLPDGNTVSLVHHQNAPYPGVEIYLSPNLSDPAQVLLEAFSLLEGDLAKLLPGAI